MYDTHFWERSLPAAIIFVVLAAMSSLAQEAAPEYVPAGSEPLGVSEINVINAEKNSDNIAIIKAGGSVVIEVKFKTPLVQKFSVREFMIEFKQADAPEVKTSIVNGNGTALKPGDNPRSGSALQMLRVKQQGDILSAFFAVGIPANSPEAVVTMKVDVLAVYGRHDKRLDLQEPDGSCVPFRPAKITRSPRSMDIKLAVVAGNKE